MTSATAILAVTASIAIGSARPVSSFQRSSAAVGVKPYAASLDILPIAVKIELFKYAYRRGNTVGQSLGLLRELM